MKILIVDDEYVNLINIQEGIQKRFENQVDITCSFAYTFDEAIELLSKETFQVILLDGLLYEDSDIPKRKLYGYNLIPEIKMTNSSEAKIIMISSSEMLNYKGMQMGAGYYIPKFYLIDSTSFFESLSLGFESPFLLK
ncbi:MAG: response regulator [bacterium]